MHPAKRRLLLFNCIILFLIFIIKISFAQENIHKEGASQQNKACQGLEDKIRRIQEEKQYLSLAVEQSKKETGELRSQVASLNERIIAKEIEKDFLGSILRAQSKYLKPPELAKAEEKNLKKIIHLNLGFAYGLRGQTKDAIENYQKALTYSPEDKDIHYNLGSLLSQEDRYAEAIEEFKQALKGKPEDRDVYYNLAIIYATGLKDQKTSQKYYNRFTALSLVNTVLPSQQAEKVPQGN